MQAEVLTCSHFVPLTTLPFDGLGITACGDADHSDELPPSLRP